jgi:hypothetical protein
MKHIIIGSGNSLRGFNFWQLKGQCVYAVNYSMFSVPFAPHLVFWDKSFYDNHKRDIKKFKGQVHTINSYGTPEPLFNYYNNVMVGHIMRQKTLVGNNNMSVLMAVNIAIHQGAKDIYLMGCDNHVDSGYLHYYDKYKGTAERLTFYEKETFPRMTELCNLIKKDLLPDERIITVGDSRLDMFENIELPKFVETLK